jgi:hypothetical protein
MLADHLVADLQPFRDPGFDVYIYDYRGYGLSAGKSRLAAIFTDYTEIVTDLHTRAAIRESCFMASPLAVSCYSTLWARALCTHVWSSTPLHPGSPPLAVQCRMTQ